jgi:hypothetical protein
MSGAVFTLGNSVSGSLSLGSALSKFGRVAGQAGFTIDQEEETLNNTVTSRYAGLAAVTVSGVTSVLNPSLVLIPSAYNTSGSTGILYSLHSKPNGVADFVVTRATEGTRFNSIGRISSVGSGDARLDYLTSGGTAGTPALLVEPAATNFAPNANLMDAFDTPTVSGGITLTTGSTDFLAPDGTSGSINKYVGGTATNQSTRYAGTGIGVSASGTYRFSLFVKVGATNPLNFCAIQFALFTGASGTATSYFNLASGTALTSGSSIENYGNGWYRCVSAPYTIASGDLSGTVSFFFAEGNNDVTWLASGALNLTAYTWGAQLETGSIATSYIPTTTAAVTRAADVINISSAVSGCIGQTEGTIYWEGESLASGVQDIISINQSNTNSVYITKITTNVYRCVVIASGTPLTVDDTVVKTGFVKIAFAYKSGDTALFINGAQVGSTNTTVFTFSGALNTLIFGPGDYYSGRPDQKCRAVALYSTRLTNAQLAALTTP